MLKLTIRRLEALVICRHIMPFIIVFFASCIWWYISTKLFLFVEETDI